MMRPTLVTGVLLLAAAGAGAQPKPGSDPGNGGNRGQTPVTSESVQPIECWWRTSASSVRVGELFSVVLTCAVLDTSATTVVPDQSRLDPSVLQLPPFEVTGGTQAADLHTRSRRFFQYEYTLRYIGEEFGRDLALPPLSVGYKVQNRVAADGAAIESRDRQYILPAQTVRVVSLVPMSTSDIRDRAPDTFRGIAGRRFRSSVLRIVAFALFGLSAIVLVWAMVRAFRSRRARTVGPVRLASDGAILRHAARELDAVERQRRIDGWTPELLSRGLAALRIAGAYATTGHVSQRPWSDGVAPGDGRLIVRSLLRPGRATVVSGSATAGALAQEMRRRELRNGHQAGPLTDLHPALAGLDAAAYRRPGAAAPDLDDAMASGLRGMSAVRREHRWLPRRLKALVQSAGVRRRQAWAP